MSMTKGTPASSQIIWLEQRVKTLEEQVHKLSGDRDALYATMQHMAVDFISDEYRIELATAVLDKVDGLPLTTGA